MHLARNKPAQVLEFVAIQYHTHLRLMFTLGWGPVGWGESVPPAPHPIYPLRKRREDNTIPFTSLPTFLNLLLWSRWVYLLQHTLYLLPHGVTTLLRYVTVRVKHLLSYLHAQRVTQD